MRELVITKNEQGQRLDKYLKKYLEQAPSSFVYKMLRKKNITVNGKKATPEQMVGLADRVQLYLAEETIDKFRTHVKEAVSESLLEYQKAYEQYRQEIAIVYEDEHVLILHKPAGILSQKAKKEDASCNEYAIGYLLANQCITQKELLTFKPSICNRLDRNTSGLLLVGVSLYGSQRLSEMIHHRTIGKYYVCVVTGQLQEACHLTGYLRKNHKTNTVEILSSKPVSEKDEVSEIHTYYEPLEIQSNRTLLQVELITGKTHQIRAHLASIGHAIVGDQKYGSREKQYKYQLLHAYKLVFPKDESIGALQGVTIELPIPEQFCRAMKE